MCEHAKNTNKVIQHMVQGLYPAIQYQFVLISAISDFSNSEKAPFKQFWTLVHELKTEFQSLANFEIKSVFPAVIKIFSKTDIDNTFNLPNINYLLKQTKAKESRVLSLVEALHHQLKEVAFEAELDNSFQIIERLFMDDFKVEKQKWNNMISERMNHCSCFKKILAGFDEMPLGSIYSS